MLKICFYLNDEILKNSYEKQIPTHEEIYKNKNAIIGINFEMIKRLV